MSYSITRTDGTLLTNVQDYTRDTTSTSLTLLGRGSVDYGESVAENFVHMVENFAGPTPPANPLPGQTWYQTFDPGPPITAVNKLQYWNGTKWQAIGGAVSSSNPPENPKPGDLWYNQEDSQIYYWDGFKWTKVGGPYTGVPGGQDPATLPPGTTLPPPADPAEGDLWWMLPERQLWAYDSALASLSCFPPKSKRVDGTVVPNGWVLIGPAGRIDPNDPTGGSYSGVTPVKVTNPVTGLDEDADLYMIVLGGKILTVWTPKLVILKDGTINGMPFGSWTDPYDTNADPKTLQAGLNMNHVAADYMNGQAADSERLNGLNSAQFLRSDQSTKPLTTDVVFDLGSKESHWLNFFSKYHYGMANVPGAADADIDVSEVSFFGMAQKALLCEAAEKAKMFTAGKKLSTPDTEDVAIVFTDLFLTEANEYVGTAKLTDAGKAAVKEIADASAASATSQLPSGAFVPIDKDSVPAGPFNQGNDGTRWGIIFANTFDGTATKAKFADLAERYEADDVYTKGTLLSIGGPNEVTITNGEYDYNFFGVVSDAPAYLMNSAAGTDDTHPPVALAGRVEVRVVGSALKGNRLVLSEIPGVARAVVDDPSFLQPQFVVGRILVDKPSEDEELVLAVVQAK